MLKEHLEQLFEFIAHNIPEEQIMQAKKEYQKMTGEIYEDDRSYNTRMALFLEWYLLDNYIPGSQKTILENIIEENHLTWEQSHLEACQDITNNIQALFEVKRIRDNSVTVLNLFNDEKYLVHEGNSKLVFRKNDIFQGRIAPHKEKWNFTGYFCFHPIKTQRYLKDEAKKIFLIQQIWKKELSGLEKELSEKEKKSSKNYKYIQKIKIKIERTDKGTKKNNLINKLLFLEHNGNSMAISNQETNKKINRLKIETIKLEGRNLISELINKLAYMNLKWERSRQIEIFDIYKN
jgi:hypothetical protein